MLPWGSSGLVQTLLDLPDRPVPILDAADARGLKVGPPRGAAVLRAGAGQRRVTVLDGVAALSGGLREEGDGSVTVVETSVWR